MGETLLTAVMNALGSKCTPAVVDAWTHCLAFCLREMLPTAIAQNIVEGELMNNSYADDAVLDVAERYEIDDRHSDKHSKSSARSRGSFHIFNDGASDTGSDFCRSHHSYNSGYSRNPYGFNDQTTKTAYH